MAMHGFARIMGITMLLLIIVVSMMFLKPTFVDQGNLSNLLRWTALFGFLSLGAAFVIITGGIDLSIGSVVALSGITLMILLQVTYYDSGKTVTIATVHTDIENDINSVVLTQPPPDYAHLDQFAIAVPPDPNIPGDMGGPDILLTIDKQATQTLNQANTLVVQNNVWMVNENSPAKLLAQDYMNPSLAVGITLLVGMGIGLIHGLLIGYAKIQPFIVTLCGLMAYRGLARLISDDKTMSTGIHHGDLRYLANGRPFEVPLPGIRWISEGNWSTSVTDNGVTSDLPFWGWVSIPMPMLIMLVLAVIGAVFLHKTVSGRYLLAMGRNEEAARFSGINTRLMTVLAYVLCSGLAALGGVLFALDINTVQPSSHGNFYELYAIAAAVLGGCSLRGGVGSIAGVVIGTAVMRTLYNAIELLEKKDYWMYIIIGAVLLLGVMMDELGRNAINSFKTRQRRRQLSG